TVTVRIRTRIAEEGTRRRIQHVALRCRRVGKRPLKFQLNSELMHRRKNGSQRLGGRTVTTQLVHASLTRDGLIGVHKFPFQLTSPARRSSDTISLDLCLQLAPRAAAVPYAPPRA